MSLQTPPRRSAARAPPCAIRPAPEQLPRALPEYPLSRCAVSGESQTPVHHGTDENGPPNRLSVHLPRFERKILLPVLRYFRLGKRRCHSARQSRRAPAETLRPTSQSDLSPEYSSSADPSLPIPLFRQPSLLRQCPRSLFRT